MLAADDFDIDTEGPTVELRWAAGLLAHDHPLHPAVPYQVPPQWRGACAAVAGGGPNRATAIVVARLVFTISGQSRAFTALRLIDIVTASHSHMNELATLEFGLQQLARLEDELAPDGAVPGPLMLALSSRTRIGTVDRANADCRGDAAG